MTFWIVVLVGFLAFVIINAIRGRHYSSAVYRARFKSRMPQGRPESEAANDTLFTTPVILGVFGGDAHHGGSTGHCTPSVAVGGGACNHGGAEAVNGDGGST